MTAIRADIRKALNPPPKEWTVAWTDADGVRHNDTRTKRPVRWVVAHPGAFKRGSVLIRRVMP